MSRKKEPTGPTIAEFIDMLQSHVEEVGGATEVVISYDGMDCQVLEELMEDGKLVLVLSRGY